MKYYFLINNRLRKLCEIIENKFNESPKSTYFEHSLRVANYCYQIGTSEKINLDIIIAAALIHDIGRVTKPSFSDHISGTKEEGCKILSDCGYSEIEIKSIMEIAVSHHPKKDEILDNIYQQILFDADNLESVGIFGILRWYVSMSSKLEYMIKDAEMYIDNFSVSNRDKFFYTKYAQEKGEYLIKEGMECANKIIEFCKLGIKQSNNLIPISIKSNI